LTLDELRGRAAFVTDFFIDILLRESGPTHEGVPCARPVTSSTTLPPTPAVPLLLRGREEPHQNSPAAGKALPMTVKSSRRVIALVFVR
jgi:hypothetical protein